ncbi:tellurite resistance protein [Ensifer adhaerens]|uniref:Tellurite resistance protein n=1 Tax=Ensifer adhaerens TaxID=106592 RepID=A0ACC5T2B4_ENSAD|nr:hypothetical protein [Ensifer adhaerens]MBP1875263.1 tellurite resistance protein [Ensifer adhaerens]
MISSGGSDGAEISDRQLFGEVKLALSRLSGRRLSKIEVEGPFLRSKLAWKIAVYQQAILYRIVALGTGTIRACDADDTIVGILTARAFIETVAVLQDVATRIERHLGREDLEEIDAIIMAKIFATRDTEMVREEAKLKSTNVLTSIEALDQAFPGVLQHYNLLSERCHPNTMGHHQLFATTDRVTGTVIFSEGKRIGRERDSALTGVMLAIFVATIDG